jgi:hypothetical protein
MTATTPAVETASARGLWKRRLVAVLGAVAGAVVAYLVTNTAVTGGLKTPAMGDQPPSSLNAGIVIGVSAVVALAAWGLLALLERFTSKGILVWRVVAAVVLVFSLGGPLSGDGITGGNRLCLALMHIVVGAVLILFLPRRRLVG